MNHLRASTSVRNSAFIEATFRVVELVGAQRPDLELIIWASVTAQTNREVNDLAALISSEDGDLLERLVRSVFWSYGLHLCDWAGGLPGMSRSTQILLNQRSNA